MEIFYELMMKNGLCFLAGTNHEGICEFSINGNEFVIYTLTDRNGHFLNFSFSVDTTIAEENYAEKESALPEDFSVLSVRKVDEKRKKLFNRQNRKPEEILKTASFKRVTTGLRDQMPGFSARRGCISTPEGWIFS